MPTQTTFFDLQDHFGLDKNGTEQVVTIPIIFVTRDQSQPGSNGTEDVVQLVVRGNGNSKASACDFSALSMVASSKLSGKRYYELGEGDKDGWEFEIIDTSILEGMEDLEAQNLGCEDLYYKYIEVQTHSGNWKAIWTNNYSTQSEAAYVSYLWYDDWSTPKHINVWLNQQTFYNTIQVEHKTNSHQVTLKLRMRYYTGDSVAIEQLDSSFDLVITNPHQVEYCNQALIDFVDKTRDYTMAWDMSTGENTWDYVWIQEVIKTKP
jgi:hypothetical protein